LEKQHVDAKAELTQLLAKDSAAAPLSADAAISRYKTWKVKHAALVANITDAKELDVVIEALIDKLKRTQAPALNAGIQRQVDELIKLQKELGKPAKSTKPKNTPAAQASTPATPNGTPAA
jgi:hypothetical protein